MQAAQQRRAIATSRGNCGQDPLQSRNSNGKFLFKIINAFTVI